MNNSSRTLSSPLVFSRSTPNYQINLENFLRMPTNVYWVNLSGMYLGCNDHMAEDAGLRSPKDFVGLTIYDVSNKEKAKLIDTTDKRVIQSGTSHCVIESSGALYSPEGTYLSIKSPLLNETGKIVGLLGMSLRLNDATFIKITTLLQEAKIINKFSMVNDVLKKHYTSGDILKDTHFTRREAEVLFYLSRRKSTKEIARMLAISHRTVEKHIEHMKLKMNCYSKNQLLDKFFEIHQINL